MRLLHVIGSMNPQNGGPAEVIRCLGNKLSENGDTVEIVCLDDPDSEFLSKETMKIHALGRGKGQWNYHPQLLPWLNKNLSRFDAIIQHGLWQYPGYALSKAASRPKMSPYFIFPHGMLDPWFQRAPERRLKAVRNWLYWKFIEQRVVQNASALLFTCQEEMRLAAETFRPYRPKRQVNVGFGVPHPPSYNSEMGKAFKAACPGVIGNPYFLFLGRIHPKKGIDLLLEAYSMLCRSHSPASLPKIVIAGPGMETSYGQNIKKSASKACPSDSVFWPGMLLGNQKWGAFYNCEASVLTSHQENFGIAVVEALACGRPVLISNQVNIWREVKASGAALVQEDSVEGAWQLLKNWISLPADTKLKMAVGAKTCFQSDFSVESATRKLLATLNSPSNC